MSLTLPGFVGDEKQIRLFLTVFYWLATHGSGWPFSSISSAQLDRQYNELKTHKVDPIAALQEELFWAVCRIRMAHGHYVGYCARFEDVFGEMASFDETIYKQELFAKRDPEARRAESCFFYFYQNKTINFTPLTENEQALQEFLLSQKTPANDVVEALGPFLTARFPGLSADQLHRSTHLALNVLRVSFSFYLMDGNYFKQADFFGANKSSYREQRQRQVFLEFVESLPDRPAYSAFKRDPEAFAELLFYLFVPVLAQFTEEEKVKLKLLVEPTDILNRALFDFVDDLGIATRLPVCADLDEADLVVAVRDDYMASDIQRWLNGHANKVIDWYLDATVTDRHQLYERIYALYQQKQAAVNKLALKETKARA